MAGTIQIRAEGQGFVVAKYTGTAATLYLDLGFIPITARAFNTTDGDAGWTWMRGMDSGMCIGEGAALVSVTSGAITTLDGSAGNGVGLQLGTDSTYVNESAKVYICSFMR